MSYGMFSEASALAVEGGFSEPSQDSNLVFRAVMDALAHPGRAFELAVLCTPPEPLSWELGAIALALVDQETPVYCDIATKSSSVVREWLQFQTGTRMVEKPANASFGLISKPDEMPPLKSFAMGSNEYPDRSTTIVLDVGALSGERRLTLVGPGIETTSSCSIGTLPRNFIAQWNENNVAFPCGVDVLVVAQGFVIGFPRTVRIREGEP